MQVRQHLQLKIPAKALWNSVNTAAGIVAELCQGPAGIGVQRRLERSGWVLAGRLDTAALHLAIQGVPADVQICRNLGNVPMAAF